MADAFIIGLDALTLVKEEVASWKTSYMHSARAEVSRAGDPAGSSRIVSTFSKPTPQVPIPEIVVCIHWLVQPAREKSPPVLQYYIENQDLIHAVGDGVLFSEAWLDEVVAQKAKVRGAYLELMTKREKNILDEVEATAKAAAAARGNGGGAATASATASGTSNGVPALPLEKANAAAGKAG
eukprot:tig00001249_g7772.t1